MSVGNLTRRAGNQLYKFAFPVYRPLYSAFKSYSDRGERSILRSRIPARSVVVDAGANIGIYSAFLADCVGRHGMVHSFEPDRDNFARLESALSHRRNLRLNQLAVGDLSGSTILYLSRDLNVDHRTYPTENESREERTIHSVRLDEYFRPGERVDFIKLDIQGFELHALRGAARILAENLSITLLLEFWPYGLKCAGSSGEELLDFLYSNRFHCSLITNGILTQEASPNLSPDDPANYVNLFASRPA